MGTSKTTADGADLGNVQVSYRVVRYPDEVVIEESTTSTSVYDWNIPQGLNLYRYGVTAIALSTPSEEGLSPKVVTGLAITALSGVFYRRKRNRLLHYHRCQQRRQNMEFL